MCIVKASVITRLVKDYCDIIYIITFILVGIMFGIFHSPSFGLLISAMLSSFSLFIIIPSLGVRIGKDDERSRLILGRAGNYAYIAITFLLSIFILINALLDIFPGYEKYLGFKSINIIMSILLLGNITYIISCAIMRRQM